MSAVKPILKKLTHSEKNSLDLNRSEIYGLGLNVSDYNGPGGRSSLGDGGVGNSRHYRSTSTETTASSKMFVHPFAQSPRPYTPPLGQANSHRENEFAHDNLAISEDEVFPPRSQSTLSSHRVQVNNNNSGPGTLRIQTSRRTNHSGSQSNLHSPLAIHSSDHISPSAAMSPISVRSSFDRIPRIRSRSDLSTISHADAVRQARRQFQEKEAAKDRKHAQDEIRAMEKQTARDEKKHGRKSTATSIGGRSKRSRSDLTQNEKTAGLVGTDYNSTSRRPLPFHADSTGSGREHRAAQSAKKKTHNLWTEFVLWMRTKLFKIGRKASRH